MFIILFGPPGIGKGTQSEKISNEFNIPKISTGDILRQAIESGTRLGLSAKKLMDSGDLVPDEIVLRIVEHRAAEDDCKNGFILDGFPRTIPQAEGLSAFMESNNLPNFKCIEIQVPDEVIIERLLLRGRNDDTEETIRKRLDIYKKDTAPVKNYYMKINNFYKVNGNATIDEVYKDIITIITS